MTFASSCLLTLQSFSTGSFPKIQKLIKGFLKVLGEFMTFWLVKTVGSFFYCDVVILAFLRGLFPSNGGIFVFLTALLI